MEACKLCGDRGIIVEGGIARPCSCMRSRSLLKKVENSHLTNKMRNFTFDQFNFNYYSKTCNDSSNRNSYYDIALKSFNAARDFAERCIQGEKPDGLFITGPVGSGKTYLACCIANQILNRGKQVLFLVVPDFLDSIRATYDSTKREQLREIDLVDGARKTPVLILDDLGAHNYTEWTKNKLYSILNYRLNNCLPTIITTNISLEDLAVYLGDRTTSRLFEMCRPYRLLVEVDIRILMRQAANK